MSFTDAWRAILVTSAAYGSCQGLIRSPSRAARIAWHTAVCTVCVFPVVMPSG